ncbi:MAG: hypothetical protein J6C92_08940 [Bacteroidaceae bacterium]|nr:hypothetical protein [Bacteroidaceae bacterium]
MALHARFYEKYYLKSGDLEINRRPDLEKKIDIASTFATETHPKGLFA